MIEKLSLIIQIVPRFLPNGKFQVQALLNGKVLYENKQVFTLVELFYATIKPENSTQTKITMIKNIRKQTEELLAILTVQEAALQGTVPAVTEIDDCPF